MQFIHLFECGGCDGPGCIILQFSPAEFLIPMTRAMIPFSERSAIMVNELCWKEFETTYNINRGLIEQLSWLGFVYSYNISHVAMNIISFRKNRTYKQDESLDLHVNLHMNIDYERLTSFLSTILIDYFSDIRFDVDIYDGKPRNVWFCNNPSTGQHFEVTCRNPSIFSHIDSPQVYISDGKFRQLARLQTNLHTNYGDALQGQYIYRFKHISHIQLNKRH